MLALLCFLYLKIPLPPPRSVIVHILHDNTLTADNRDKFSYIAGMYNQTVKFYNVEKLCADRIAEFQRSVSNREKFEILTIASMYRLLIVDIILQNKIIYIDSDVIVNLDIKKLWQIDLGDKILAAVSEQESSQLISKNYLPLCIDGFVNGEDYFNAGILVMNLQQLRNESANINRGLKIVAENPRYDNLDQDILNYCFSTRYLKLPVNFNKFVVHSRRVGDYSTENRICHYISTSLGRGVNMNLDDAFNRLWFKYFAKTPWFNEETIGHIYEGTRQMYIEQKNFATQISALISGKTRAFFVEPNQIEAVRQIFYVKPEEEIIAAESPESLQRVANSLAARDKVFFILIGNYFAVAQPLIQAGFVEGRDFLNGALFLSDAHGVPFNSYSLIKLL